MEGTFHCPECGNEIRPGDQAPGRLTRCDWCESWVEVPFLPRVAPKRHRTKRGWKAVWKAQPAWARVTLPVLGAVVAVAVLWRVVTATLTSAEAQAVARLVASSEAAASAGRLGPALADVEGALALASRMKPPPGDLPAIREKRNALALREASARLTALRGPSVDADPGRAVGEALTLRTRAGSDPALAPLEGDVETTLEALRLKWADADARDALQAFEAGQAARALELCRRRYRNADDLPAADARRHRDDTTALVRRLVARHGAVIAPVQGRFTMGTPDSYDTPLRIELAEALRRHGYLPRPKNDDWTPIWDESAPFRVLFSVNESQDNAYLASPNRLSLLEGKLAMSQRGTVIWTGQFSGRTEVPLPRLAALAASRIAAAERRSPEFERILYENARSHFQERLGLTLKTFPDCPGTAPAATVSSRQGG